MNDLNPASSPSSQGVKFKLAATSDNSPSFNSSYQLSSISLRSKMRSLVGISSTNASPNDPPSPANVNSNCLQIMYHQSWPNVLLLLYQRELLMVDLTINVTIGVLTLPRNYSNLVKVFSCWRTDILVALHENSTITVYNTFVTTVNHGSSEIAFSVVAQSDCLRVNKHNSCLGFSVDPVTTSTIALYMADGKVFLKEFFPDVSLLENESSKNNSSNENNNSSIIAALLDAVSNTSTSGKDNQSNLAELQNSECDNFDAKNDSVNDLLANIFASSDNSIICDEDLGRMDNENNKIHPLPAISIEHFLKYDKLRLIPTKVVSNPLSIPSASFMSSSAPLVLRMCPPLTIRNLAHYRPLLALGSSTGHIVIVNAATGSVERDFGLHTCSVRGIEWTSLHSILTFGHQTLTQSQGPAVRNELFHLDLKSGVGKDLRIGFQSESPIVAIRVSYLKQYFLVVRKHMPIELWCCRTSKLLRTLPQRFPISSAIEWSPTSHVRRKKSDSVSSEYNIPFNTAKSEANTNCDGSESVGSLNQINEAEFGKLDAGESDMTGSSKQLKSVLSLPLSQLNQDSSLTSFTDASPSPMIAKSMTSSATFPSAEVLKSSIITASPLPSSTSMNDVSSNDTRIVKETFMIADSEGFLYHLSVEGNVIKDSLRVPPDPSMQKITSIACKSHLMVLSDSDSNISLMDLNSRFNNHINTSKGYIKKVRFAPGKDNLKLLVLYADSAEVWDMKDGKRVGQYRSEDLYGNRIVDGDWAASDRPVIITADGSIRIVDINLQENNSALLSLCVNEQFGSPHLLDPEATLNMRTILTYQPWREEYNLSLTTEDGFNQQQLNIIIAWMNSIPEMLKRYLVGCQSTLHRAHVIAQLFGDQAEMKFWTLATYYLQNLGTMDDSIKLQNGEYYFIHQYEI